jgi:hypothetical protein
MTTDNSGMPSLPTLARWVANDYHPNTPVYDASEADAAMLAYGRQVAQMCMELCSEESAKRMRRDAAPEPGDEPNIQGHKAVTAAVLAAAIGKRFGLEKP